MQVCGQFQNESDPVYYDRTLTHEFQYCENNTPLFYDSNFSVVFHEFLSALYHIFCVMHKLQNFSSIKFVDDSLHSMTLKHVIRRQSSGMKRYNIVWDTYHAKYSNVTKILELFSSRQNTSYNLYLENDFNAIFSEIKKYDRFHDTMTHLTKPCSDVIKNIGTLCGYGNRTDNTKCNIVPEIVLSKSQSVSDVIKSASSILDDIVEKHKVFESVPAIDKVDLFPTNELSEDTTEIDTENPETILEKIKELEDVEKMLKEKIEFEKDNLDEEKDNLANFICKTKYEKALENKNIERLEAAKNKFLYDKERVYPVLYDDLFVKHKFTNISSLPLPFIAQFVTFLFMDGKDHNGVSVRPRLLDRPDEYDIYVALKDAITDEDADLSDNIEYIKIIEEFISQLPDINMLYPSQLMDILNKTNSNPIFDEVEYENDDDNFNSDSDDMEPLSCYSKP